MIQRRHSQGCVCCVHMCRAGDKGWDVPGKGMFENNFRNIMNLGHGSSTSSAARGGAGSFKR